jgi:hypothetical protein
VTLLELFLIRLLLAWLGVLASAAAVLLTGRLLVRLILGA